MPLAFQPAPWAGTPTSVWASQGAAVPVMSGAGFNWAAIVGGMYGGPISHYRPTTRGIPMTASFVRRYGGLRGLGQDSTTNLDYFPGTLPTDTSTGTDTTTLTNPFGITYTTQTGSTGTGFPTTPQASTGGFNLQSILAPLAMAGANIGTLFAQYQNPLLQKGTVSITPQGIYASNSPTGISIPGLTSGGSMLPILLIGGVLVLMLVMKK